MKGLTKKHIYIPQRHRQQCGNSQRERGRGGGGGGQRWRDVRVEGDFAWGDGRTVRGADDVLLSCALETCMAL